LPSNGEEEKPLLDTISKVPEISKRLLEDVIEEQTETDVIHSIDTQEASMESPQQSNKAKRKKYEPNILIMGESLDS
jgi:hypothetical protein